MPLADIIALHERIGEVSDLNNMLYEDLLALEDIIGDVKVGLDPQVIDALPRFSYVNLLNNEEDQCVICQFPYEDGMEVCSLYCTHNFHFDCIRGWLARNRTCPLCREEVNST